MATVTRPVFLLTDFGLQDHYVGQVKGVIASLAPQSPIYDLTHDVAAFAVEEGAWLLETSIEALPLDAVVMAVVDPGVGTARRPLVVQVAAQTFIGPDNGLLSGVIEPTTDARCAVVDAAVPAGGSPRRTVLTGIRDVDVRELCEPSLMRRPVSNTFHARDVFAPAAAHIAAGADYRRAGPPLKEMLVFAPFCATPAGFGVLRGHVIHVDRYGNLVTTVRGAQLFAGFVVEVNGQTVDTHVRTFAEVPPGRPFCHVDSSGYVAVAMNQGDAASVLGASRGTPVRVLAR